MFQHFLLSPSLILAYFQHIDHSTVLHNNPGVAKKGNAGVMSYKNNNLALSIKYTPQ